MTAAAQSSTRGLALGYLAAAIAVTIWAAWILWLRVAVAEGYGAPLTGVDVALLRFSAPMLLLAPIWLRFGLGEGLKPSGVSWPVLIAMLGWGAPFVRADLDGRAGRERGAYRRAGAGRDAALGGAVRRPVVSRDLLAGAMAGLRLHRRGGGGGARSGAGYGCWLANAVERAMAAGRPRPAGPVSPSPSAAVACRRRGLSAWSRPTPPRRRWRWR